MSIETKLSCEKHGRNYTCRIHRDHPAADRTISKIEQLDRHGIRIIEKNPDDVYTPLGYVSYRTCDREGPLPNCGKFEYSPQWESFPSLPGKYKLEMRNGSCGGTKIRGEVRIGGDDPALPTYVTINTTVDFTPSEIKAIYNDDYDGRHELVEQIGWAVDDRLDELRDQYHEKRRDALEECDHILNSRFGREYWCGCCEFSFQRDELVNKGIELPDGDSDV